MREIVEPTLEERKEMFYRMIDDWYDLANFKGFRYTYDENYPYISINDFTIDIETQTYMGEEDEVTDKFRDFLRHYGVRIYTDRGF